MFMKLKEIKKLVKIDKTSPTGLRWKVDRTRGVKAGDFAGSLDKGYFRLGLRSRLTFNHRVIYAIYHNLELDQLPRVIDHIDRNPQNNSPSNLRAASYAQNRINCDLNKNNTSGVKGVHRIKDDKLWKAQIKVAGEQLYLGYFEDLEEAKKAYQEAAVEYFGEFAGL